MTSATDIDGWRRRPRRRPFLIIVVTAMLVAGALGFASWLGTVGADENGRAAAPGSQRVPLRPGPTRVGGDGSGASIEGVTLEEMIERADVVFVGRVSEIGGVETSDGDSPSLPFPAHRIRYEVERALLGGDTGEIVLTNPVISEAVFPAEVGKAYLIFAEWRELGDARIRRLVPSGYSQGVYATEDFSHASNETSGSVPIEAIEAKLAARR